MSELKVIYKGVIKTIDEPVLNYESLLSTVKILFLSEINVKDSDSIKICYLDKDEEKIEISSDEDLEEITNYHMKNCENIQMKLELICGQLNKSLNIDEMLQNMKLSESFSVMEKKEVNQNQLPMQLINIEENNSLPSSMIKSEVNNITCKLSNSQGKENHNQDPVINKASVEIPLIKNSEIVGKSNVFVDNKEQSISSEQKISEIGSHNKNLSIKDDCTQNSHISKLKEESVISKQSINNSCVNQVKISTSPENVALLFKDDIINQIDHMFTAKMSKMEEHLKTMFENQQIKMSVLVSNLHQINPKNLDLTNNSLKNEHQIVKQPKIEINSMSQNLNANRQINYKEDENTYNSLFIKNENKEDQKNHFEENCSSCGEQILINKYICILCENFFLCNQCESLHNQHPLIKVNFATNQFLNKADIINSLLENESKNGNMSKRNSIIKSPYCINLYSTNKSTIFAMGARSSNIFTLQIKNISSKNIEEEILIMAINNKNFNVSQKIVWGLASDYTENIELKFDAPQQLGTYEFEVIARLRNDNLKCEPVRIKIFVVMNEDVDETNANLFFEGYKEILELPKDKKVVIYNMISQEIIKNNMNELLRVIRKYKDDIDQAIDELTKENQRGECYYGQQYDHLHINI